MSRGDWGRRLLARGELPSWDRYTRQGGDLGAVLREFLDWQSRSWPRLETALVGLRSIETREIALGARRAVLQWNPGRQASTTARVDADSLKERPCFLCPRNQPPEERGLPFGEQLVVLPNPAPITPFHLVVALREHVGQELDACLDVAVDFAVATRGHLTVLYNGPLCGASAPDHLHLQAFAAGAAPDECQAWNGRLLVQSNTLEMRGDRSSHRQVISLRGEPDAVADGIRATVGIIGEVLAADGEPPVNLLLWGKDDEVRAMVYPRGAHRPECYTAEGPDRCLISPGALDMAGLVITVRREDYERVDAVLLGRIFEQTSVVGERAEEIERRLVRRP